MVLTGPLNKVRRSDSASETQDLAQTSAVPHDRQGRATNPRSPRAKIRIFGLNPIVGDMLSGYRHACICPE